MEDNFKGREYDSKELHIKSHYSSQHFDIIFT